MLNSIHLKIVLLILLAVLNVNAKIRYDKYKLVRLHLNSIEQAELIAVWDTHDDEFDIWSSDKSTYVDVLLSPNAFLKYLPQLNANRMNFDIMQSDIQAVIDQQEMEHLKSKQLRSNIINRFATYPEIQSFIDTVVLENPNIASSYITGEKTLEGRQLKVIVLKTAQSTKPVWIDCGIHAREWVAPATCVYIIDQLVKEYNENSASSLLNTYEFHILPLVNPDGYTYSMTTSRLWRKNRSVNSGSTCRGVDLNRNYDFNWLVNEGSSSNPCSDIFAGPTPDSEPETKAVESAIKAKLGQWNAFFTVHSYGQWWLIGYAHSTNKLPDYDELERVGIAGTAAIAAETSDNTKFVVGMSSVLLYLNCGSSRDWAKGVANVKYSYTLELRPGQNSPDASYGFLLPESRLPNLTKETLAGIKGALAAINNNI